MFQDFVYKIRPVGEPGLHGPASSQLHLIAPPWGPVFKAQEFGEHRLVCLPSSDVGSLDGENQEAPSKQVR